MVSCLGLCRSTGPVSSFRCALVYCTVYSIVQAGFFVAVFGLLFKLTTDQLMLLHNTYPDMLPPTSPQLMGGR